MSAEAGLLVSDALSRAFAAVQAAGVRPGHTVAVVGGGTVGLLSAMCARLAGASQVLVADPLQVRPTIAAELGFDPVMPDELTVPGQGADAVIEAVGSYPALACAVSAVGPRAVVAVAGAHHGAGGPFPAGHAFARELTVTFVVGDPIATRSQVIGLVRAEQLNPAAIISHRMPLASARDKANTRGAYSTMSWLTGMQWTATAEGESGCTRSSWPAARERDSGQLLVTCQRRW